MGKAGGRSGEGQEKTYDGRMVVVLAMRKRGADLLRSRMKEAALVRRNRRRAPLTRRRRR